MGSDFGDDEALRLADHLRLALDELGRSTTLVLFDQELEASRELRCVTQAIASTSRLDEAVQVNPQADEDSDFHLLCFASRGKLLIAALNQGDHVKSFGLTNDVPLRMWM